MVYDYRAPLDDVRFVLKHIAKLDELLEHPEFQEFTPDLMDAVLEEVGKFAGEVLFPINQSGDKVGAVAKDGIVTMPQGFKEAYQLFTQNGWNAMPFAPEHGGQGLPWVVTNAASEFWSSANMAFALCPLLTQGMVGVVEMFGNDHQKEFYLPKLVSGEWTGTMCLTEPQAGSDVGAIATKAVKDGEHYKLKGTKIYITYGDHDLTENIIHLVLARTPDAPEGTKGISLFIVPKFLEDGSRNDVHCVSIEHKTGIHASPTAVLSFGDKGGAVGYLVGEECQGIQAMFTMMNHARLGVGIEGIAIAEAALQQAEAYAAERVQGRGMTIDKHPDVRRMLMTMRANTEAMRALALYMTRYIDLDERENNADARGRVALLTPIVKAHGSDIGFEMASLAMQVFGGIGYIEETGVAQLLRDSRIAMIYEGTNGIQALDLVMRKITLDDGKYYKALVVEMREAVKQSALPELAKAMEEAIVLLEDATAAIIAKTKVGYEQGAFVATPYLRLFGVVAGGYMMLLSADAAKKQGDVFGQQKLETCQFYMNCILPEVKGIAAII